MGHHMWWKYQKWRASFGQVDRIPFVHVLSIVDNLITQQSKWKILANSKCLHSENYHLEYFEIISYIEARHSGDGNERSHSFQ